MPDYLVTYTRFVTDVDDADEAIQRADDGKGGGHWEAIEMENDDD